MAKKKQSREELAFPIATVPNLSNPMKPTENLAVIKQIILGAIKGAYQLKTPNEPGPYHTGYGKRQKPIVTEEQIQLVTHLIETLEPANAIEAALASQFVITYIRGLDYAQDTSPRDMEATLKFFEFGHQVLETLQRYRTKGAQLISVNYNHNQGQINNIKIIEKDTPQHTIEVN